VLASMQHANMVTMAVSLASMTLLIVYTDFVKVSSNIVNVQYLCDEEGHDLSQLPFYIFK
jgi:hypothetical protein